jgi:phosphopentomutase
MARAFLIVIDSVGCGGAADAARYGDTGADTLGHIAEACAKGRADRRGLRSGPLALPFLSRLGLTDVCEHSSGLRPLLAGAPSQPQGLWGHAVETSQGKDTVSGHWEMAGTPADFAFGYFERLENSFPPELIEALITQGSLPGILGNCHASGTAIVEQLGAEHVTSGKPIVYTSIDSVLQIAAHEESFGLERLYALCRLARGLVDPLKIGRVIARPFIGSLKEGFHRTGNRKDFAIPPPHGTLLDRAAEAQRDIATIGKIGDIFTHRNTGREVKAAGNMALFDAMLPEVDRLADGGFLFANFVDFDSEFGHRRDVAGYAACLEAFDRRLPELEARLKPDDLVIFTADHGNDPTWAGTDHTREHVPVLGFGPGLAPRAIGERASFADIGESIAQWLGLPKGPKGKGWF